MTDIATVHDHDASRLDWAFDGRDLVFDDGLATALLISLFADARAAESDTVPDGATVAGTGLPDRRGWWGDGPAGEEDPGPVGSRLWLLDRALRANETLLAAESHAADALAWLLAEGIAARVDIAVSWAAEGLAPGYDRLVLDVTIVRRDGGIIATRYDDLWSGVA